MKHADICMKPHSHIVLHFPRNRKKKTNKSLHVLTLNKAQMWIQIFIQLALPFTHKPHVHSFIHPKAHTHRT